MFPVPRSLRGFVLLDELRLSCPFPVHLLPHGPVDESPDVQFDVFGLDTPEQVQEDRLTTDVKDERMVLVMPRQRANAVGPRNSFSSSM